MTPLKIKIALASGAVVLGIATLRWSFTPTNYNDCVLDGMENAQNERAARLIANACRSKFPSRVSSGSSFKITKYTGPKYEGPNPFEEFGDIDEK